MSFGDNFFKGYVGGFLIGRLIRKIGCLPLLLLLGGFITLLASVYSGESAGTLSYVGMGAIVLGFYIKWKRKHPSVAPNYQQDADYDQMQVEETMPQRQDSSGYSNNDNAYTSARATENTNRLYNKATSYGHRTANNHQTDVEETVVQRRNSDNHSNSTSTYASTRTTGNTNYVRNKGVSYSNMTTQTASTATKLKEPVDHFWTEKLASAHSHGLMQIVDAFDIPDRGTEVTGYFIGSVKLFDLAMIVNTPDESTIVDRSEVLGIERLQKLERAIHAPNQPTGCGILIDHQSQPSKLIGKYLLTYSRK